MKKIIFFSLLILIFAQNIWAENQESQKNQANTNSANKIKIYYFHITQRCPSCTEIEKLTDLALKENFSQELKNGQVIWQTVNVDEQANKQFIEKYKLYTRSVVIAVLDKDNKEISWKNLDKIWTLLRQETDFKNYVKQEVQNFLKAQK